MASTSLATAKTDLYNQLASDANGTPRTSAVAKVYKGELAAGFQIEGTKPVVTIMSRQSSPEFFVYLVRIYSHVSVDSVKAQDALDAAVPAVDALLATQFGPLDWEFDYSGDLNAFYAVCRMEAGREDF